MAPQLKEHLAAAASDLTDQMQQLKERGDNLPSDLIKESTARRIFSDIVKLRVGEALIFSLSAIEGLEKGPEGVIVMERLEGLSKNSTFTEQGYLAYILILNIKSILEAFRTYTHKVRPKSLFIEDKDFANKHKSTSNCCAK
jgi:hypothetical protein